MTTSKRRVGRESLAVEDVDDPSSVYTAPLGFERRTDESFGVEDACDGIVETDPGADFKHEVRGH